MKKIFAAIMLMCLSMLACAQATYSYTFQDDNGGDPYADSFYGTGTFTVAKPDLTISQPVLSWTGTFSDDYVEDSTDILIPTGQTVVAGYGLIFVYDNLIGGPNGNLFTNPGLLFEAGDTSHVNLYGDGAGNLFAYDFHTQSDGSPGGFFASAFITFSATLDSYVPPVTTPPTDPTGGGGSGGGTVSPVDEPASIYFFLLVLGALCLRQAFKVPSYGRLAY